MRVLALAALAVAAAGCGGHARVASSCVHLTRGEGPSEKTGEHTVIVVASGCGAHTVPHVELLDAHGRALAFHYDVRIGKPNGRIDLDKYRCDIRPGATVQTVRLTFRTGKVATIDIPNDSLLDYCPTEAPSTTMHVLVGAPLTGWRGVFQDVYDGKLDRYWSCDALQTAIAHLPADGPTYSTIPGILKTAPC